MTIRIQIRSGPCRHCLKIQQIVCINSVIFAGYGSNSFIGLCCLVPNSTIRTPATDMLYNTTNGRAHNNSTTCCTTNSPSRDKNLPHPRRLVAGGTWGYPKLLEKSEIFRVSEILGCRLEIFITYLYKKRTLYYCKNVLIIFPEHLVK